MILSYKSLPTSTKDVDTKARMVRVVLSQMGNIDLDNDVIDHGAFDKTIMERGPKGADLIYHLADHYPSLKYAIGKFSDLSVNGGQLIGTTIVPNTTWGSDALEMYSSGMINQHSIGFMTMKAEVSQDAKTPRVIKEVKLYEGSAVLWGANPLTPTLEAHKSAMQSADEVASEMDLYIRASKNGKLSDEMLTMLEIRILQLKDKHEQLLTTTQKTTEAEATVPLQPVSNKGKAFARQLLIASLNF